MFVLLLSVIGLVTLAALIWAVWKIASLKQEIYHLEVDRRFDGGWQHASDIGEALGRQIETLEHKLEEECKKLETEWQQTLDSTRDYLQERINNVERKIEKDRESSERYATDQFAELYHRIDALEGKRK
jgi:chromosome segregation ATPase